MKSIGESIKQRPARRADARPTHVAYTVKDLGKGKDVRWVRIGAVFAHRDGGGLDVKLDALPMDGRIVLRVPKKQETNEGQ